VVVAVGLTVALIIVLKSALEYQVAVPEVQVALNVVLSPEHIVTGLADNAAGAEGV
jgi:hypothetical protein